MSSISSCRVLGVALGGVALLAGCGPSTSSTVATRTPAAARSGPVATAPSVTAPTGTTSTPASATPGAAANDLHQAEQLVVSKGYAEGNATAGGWGVPGQLGAIASYEASGDGHTQRVFFFYNNRFLGYDTSDPSAGISGISGDGQTISVQYQLFAGNAPLCCPTGTAAVRYQWNGSTVTPLDPIPSTALRR